MGGAFGIGAVSKAKDAWVLATTAYDDDGVKTTRFPIIEKGVFKHYQTIRDQAHLVGEKESRGCCYADSWSSVPFQRMPNVSLQPGKNPLTPAELITGIITERGVFKPGELAGRFAL